MLLAAPFFAIGHVASQRCSHAQLFIRMNLPRLVLLFSAATFVILAPLVITFALQVAYLRCAFF
jgi:hypothetical protein